MLIRQLECDHQEYPGSGFGFNKILLEYFGATIVFKSLIIELLVQVIIVHPRTYSIIINSSEKNDFSVVISSILSNIIFKTNFTEENLLIFYTILYLDIPRKNILSYPLHTNNNFRQ